MRSTPVDSLVLLVAPGRADSPEVEAARSVWQSMGVDVCEIISYDAGADRWLNEVDQHRGARRVVVGDDTTVSGVVSALHRHDMLQPAPLALLPVGQANDVAGSLGVPSDPAAAAGLALRGRPVSADLAVDDRGDVLVGVARVGAEVALDPASPVEGMQGVVARAVGAVLSRRDVPSYPVRVEVDGAEVCGDDERLLMLAVSLGRTLSDPSGAIRSDGCGGADVVLVSATGALHRADFAQRVIGDVRLQREDVLVARARHVVVEARDAPLVVDGEHLGETHTRMWTVVPGAWTVMSTP